MGRRDGLGAILLGASLFAIYAAGACRTIYVGDSGELVTAVHLLGIPHPTGYPLYVLLGKLWTLGLPFGSIAWRMSLFSAACAAGACAVLFLLLRRSSHVDPVAALLAALLLAFAPSFWAEANVQRVYALNALFVVLAAWAAWRWSEQRSGSRLGRVVPEELEAVGIARMPLDLTRHGDLDAIVDHDRLRSVREGERQRGEQRRPPEIAIDTAHRRARRPSRAAHAGDPRPGLPRCSCLWSGIRARARSPSRRAAHS